MAATPESDSSPSAFSAHGLVPVSVTHSRSMTSRLLPAIRPAGPDGGVPKARAASHGALGYTVELGLLPANPIGLVRWRAPRAAAAVSPAPCRQPGAGPGDPDPGPPRIKPELAVFFGCLYYARCARKKPSPWAATTSSSRPPRPRARLSSPPPARAPAPPGPTPAIPHEPPATAPPRRRHPRRLHPARPGQHALPSPRRPWHHAGRGAVPRARGGMLSESVYGRAWHAARRAALGPDLAATALARRPYDLRHAALSLWLNATGAPAEVAARPATAPVSYTTCTSTAPAARRLRQPADRRRPQRRHRYHAFVTTRKRAVIRTVGQAPQTPLSAIRTRTGSSALPILRTATYRYVQRSESCQSRR